MPPKKQLAAMAGSPAQSIPLQCLLCPKKPSFSDVSHLLTHISSKSHLSNRFRAEIRSNTEKDARETLRQFDDWYTRYGIQSLLADRMSAKDKKSVPKRTRGQTRTVKQASSLQEELYIKPDPEPLSRRSTNETLHSLHAHGTRQSIESPPPYDLTPLPRHLRRVYPVLGLQGHHSQTASVDTSADTSVTSTTSEIDGVDDDLHDIDQAETAADEDSDKSKLKGVFWPGMNIFDSATPEQKRKRNQRKDVSVVKNMEEFAACVEPTECIWSEDIIELQRTRDIYATPTPEPEDDEPAPAPKKKRGRRSVATTNPTHSKPRRVSARIGGAKKSRKLSAVLQSYPMEEEAELEDDGDDGHTTPPSNFSEERTASPAMKSDPDAFDIFQDTSAASPPGHGQFEEILQFSSLTECVSPALTWGSTGTESSMNDVKYEAGGRRPLQQMSSNIPMMSPLNAFKPKVPLRRGHSEYGLVSAGAADQYYANHPGLGPSSYNPLLAASSHHNFTFTPSYFGPHSFAADGRPLTSGFLPINGPAINGLPLSDQNYAMANGGSFFQGHGTYDTTYDT